jgi:hypothetical protein
MTSALTGCADDASHAVSPGASRSLRSLGTPQVNGSVRRRAIHRVTALREPSRVDFIPHGRKGGLGPKPRHDFRDIYGEFSGSYRGYLLVVPSGEVGGRMSRRMYHNFLFPKLFSLNHNFPPAGQLDFRLLPPGVGILRPPGGSANDEKAGAFQRPPAMAEMPLVTGEGADQLLMRSPPEPVRDRRSAIGGAVSGAGISGLLPSFPSPRQARRVELAWSLRQRAADVTPWTVTQRGTTAPLARWGACAVAVTWCDRPPRIPEASMG